MYLSGPQVACSSHSPAVREVAVFPWMAKTPRPWKFTDGPSQSSRGVFFLPEVRTETWKRLRRKIKIDKDCTGENFGYSHGVIVVKCWKTCSIQDQQSEFVIVQTKLSFELYKVKE